MLIFVSFKNCSACWRRLYTPVISTLGEGRQKDLSSEASLGDIVRFYLQNQELATQFSNRVLPSTDKALDTIFSIINNDNNNSGDDDGGDNAWHAALVHKCWFDGALGRTRVNTTVQVSSFSL